MHIDLTAKNTEKVLRMSAEHKLDKSPNRFINQFFEKVDEESFVIVLQKALSKPDSKIEFIIAEK